MANAGRADLGNAARRELGRLLPQRRRRAGARPVSGPSPLHPHQVRRRRLQKSPRETREVQRVEDVNAFPGHIACDSASASGIVVPLVRDGELIGVLDIDSPRTGRVSSEEDEAGCVRLGEILSRVLSIVIPDLIGELFFFLWAQELRRIPAFARMTEFNSTAPSRSSLRLPRDNHHRTRQLARVVSGEMHDQRPRASRSARRRAPAPRFRCARRHSRAPCAPDPLAGR